MFTTAIRTSRSLINCRPSQIIRLRLNRATYATSSSSSFQAPKTEREVADLLAKARTETERKQIFDSIIGTQKKQDLIKKFQSEETVQDSIGRTKLSTDQTGVDVHPSPFNALRLTYNKTLKVLENIPKSTVYYQAVHSQTIKNLGIVTKFIDNLKVDQVEDQIKQAENELEVNLIEHAVYSADDEYQLALKMIKLKALVPLFFLKFLVIFIGYSLTFPCLLYVRWEDLEEKPLKGQWDYFEIPASTSYPKN
ncbi:hypothetical protein KEM48_008582 [Puccinia striiformis f. sp. tritici PST-130]|nr:hypothetical protein KEM48_008582 [Puccinia striiformis f. sp. tritici PST-130]